MGSNTDNDDFQDEFGPLVQRLQKMKWPEVPADVRERCWQDFQRLVGGPAEHRSPDRSPPRDG
jgi:hypothetical protein